MRKEHRSRFPALKKRADGSLGCRGCGGAIPSGRFTWCSHACVKKFDPVHVKRAVRERDGDRCVFCQKNCSERAQWEWHKKKPQYPSYHSCGLPFPYDRKAHESHPLFQAYKEEVKSFNRDAPLPEFDHILPHSEGGEFVLENIRLLCRSCHKERTREWHRSRKLAKQNQESSSLSRKTIPTKVSVVPQ